MQNDGETYFRLKEISKYDIQPYVPTEKRKAIMEKAMARNPKLEIRGGTRLTNPYKDIYDMVLAEKLARVEVLKESRLWSPRFTPRTFRWLFLLPMGFAVSLVLYLHYVQLPKRMMYIKQKKGYFFRDLEARGWLKDWIIEDYKDEIYEDEILKEYEEITGSARTQPEYRTDEELMKEGGGTFETRRATERAKMEVKLNQLYTKRRKEEMR